jgi:hypothetical protein
MRSLEVEWGFCFPAAARIIASGKFRELFPIVQSLAIILIELDVWFLRQEHGYCSTVSSKYLLRGSSHGSFANGNNLTSQLC